MCIQWYLQEPSSREISCLLCMCIQWYLQEPSSSEIYCLLCTCFQWYLQEPSSREISCLLCTCIQWNLQEPSSIEISCFLCMCIQWYQQEPRQGKNLRNACSVGQYVCLLLRAQFWEGESRLMLSEHNRERWVVFYKSCSFRRISHNLPAPPSYLTVQLPLRTASCLSTQGENV